MKRAKIYIPTKTAMQSAKGNSQNWILEFISKDTGINPLTGWETSTDTMSEVRLEFSTRDLAVKYAKQNNPLELQNMKESTENKQFYIVGTNLDNGEAVFLEPNKQNIYKCLRATSSLPFFTKGTCKINGLDLMDGAWSDPIPAKSAADFGANKIIVIRPHPSGYKINGLSYLGLLAGYWWKNNPKVRGIFFTEHNHYNEAVDFLTKKHKNIEILQICPDNFLKSGVVGTSKEDLTQDYHCGLEKGMDFLNANFL